MHKDSDLERKTINENKGHSANIDLTQEKSLDNSFILRNLRRFFEEYGKKFDVHYAILFGSYAREENNPLSDIDIAVKLGKNGDNLVKLAYELELIIGSNFDLVNVNDLDPVMLFEVYSDGILIFCKNLGEYYDDYVVAIGKYLDFSYILNRYKREIFDGISRSD
ncbi:MAG: nucleotidyltransferase family protein [Candidatus Njordarchaeota archaeon]